MKLLIVKTSAIGDVLQAFPVLEYLKAHYPHAQIDWVVEAGIAPLLHAHPLIDRVIEVDTKRWRKGFYLGEIRQAIHELRAHEYDALFDLQGNLKSGLITAAAKAHIKLGYDRSGVQERFNLLVTDRKITPPQGADAPTKYLSMVQAHCGDTAPFEPKGISLRLTEKEKQQLAELSLPSSCLMVCFGSNWKNKMMPEEKWVALLENRQEHLLFVHGNDQELEVARRLSSHFPDRSSVLPRLSLPLWQHVMTKCAQVISVDSAALHLAGAAGVATLGLFGASSAAYYNPKGKQHLAIQGPCPYEQKFERRCPKLRTCPTGACMTLVEIE